MAPDKTGRRREQYFVHWLDFVKKDAAAIFLLGDIFDFWFEYRYVVPRGFVRLLGKLAEITDSGIPIHFFAGNHDQWACNYLTIEMNIQIYRKPTEFNFSGKSFLIGHGHDVSPENLIEKAFNFVFINRLFRKLYAFIHPSWGIALGKNWSEKHRKCRGIVQPFKELDQELIYRYAQKVLDRKHFDFFVFGHRHLAMDIPLSGNSRYMNTGEWIEARTYAVFDGENMSIEVFGM